MSAPPPPSEPGSDELVVGGSVLALVNQSPGVTTDHHALGPRHWRRQVDRLVRAGFTEVDLTDGWLPIPTMSGPERQALGEVLADAGVRALGLNISRHSLVDPERADEHLDYSLRAVDAAAELGVPLLGVGFHPRLVPEQKLDRMFWEVAVEPADRSDAVWDLAADRLRRLCAYAGERGIQVSIELYEDTLVCTAADVERIMTAVGAPNLGVNPDLGNTFRSVTPQREHWLQTFRGALPHLDLWHVKNYTRASLGVDGPYAVAPTVLGEGMIDYRLLVGEALAAGFRGPFVVEHYGGDAVEMQRRGRDYLLGLLDDLRAEQPA
ncbi:sugar phosphate isomerase/epimerase [Microlunatus spumicola]|uniref:Sugar phosphate isomerase/epimerase n=1 Tax=Microlunatus spumicola TaxID=81499 RepID=A0ABP6WQ62_9ACTN